MSKFKGVYSVNDVDESIAPFAVGTASGCRIETGCGTVYWLGNPDDEGFRDIVREPPQDGTSGSMVMQPPTKHPKSSEVSERFRGKLRADVEVGMSLAFEVFGEKSRILSEVVVNIEPRDVPEELFR